MKIRQIFSFFEGLLPGDKPEVKAVSIYPLPYPGYFEVYLELKDGKRYRALVDKEDNISQFVEFNVGVQNGVK